MKRTFESFWGEPIDDGRHGPYKRQWICLDCQKAFKEIDRMSWQTAKKCPACGSPMRCVGQWFKPPKQKDDKAWIVLREGFACRDASRGKSKEWWRGKRLLEKWKQNAEQ
jgi:DNA-directed RNA polymerase subunit RPC12/RpoP